MSTLRHRRLGLLGVTSLLALVASTLSPLSAAADPVPSANSNVVVTKSWAPAGPVADGATSVATLTATNPTGSPVLDVYLIDYYDYGLTPTVVPGGCTVDLAAPLGMKRLYCGPFTLAANDFAAGGLDEESRNITFTANYVGPRKYTTYTKRGERMDVQKAETHVSLIAGELKTVSVKCPAGYKMVDMSFVKQHVDQGTGTYDDVHVVTSDLLVTGDEWSVTLKNDSLGQAQGKLWAVCVQTATNQGSPVVFESPPMTSSAVFHPTTPGASRAIYAYCDPGETPVAVDLRAAPDNTLPHSGGSPYTDVLIHKTGMEADGGERVRVWLTVNQPATVTLEWQCLKTATFASGKRMHFEVVSGSKTVAHGVKDQLKLTCDHGYKGIIGGWMGGKINGTEPQPVSRIYWFNNTTGSSKTYTGHLLCMRTRLVSGGAIDHSYKKPLVNQLTAVTVPNATDHWWANMVQADLEVFQ